MKAIAVHPGQRDSIHLREIPEPHVTDIPEGRGVKVKVLRVGVDGTDKEINAAEYGAAPPGEEYLVTGHESFGQVVEVGPEVPSTIRPGTYVVASVRRPGSSIYGKIGLQDFTTDDVLLRAGDQPPARLPHRVLRRGSPVRLPAPGNPRRRRRAAR